ncbi:MAG: protein-methionine-sulfoxide reductase catalytic subunit MsrP [Paracoccaceae bacterium]
MHVFKKPRWSIKENKVTNKELYFNRRKFLQNSSSIFGSTALAYNYFATYLNASQNNINNLKFINNQKYNTISEITPENLSTKYNNFFEFGSTKNIWKEAQKLKTNDWKLKISGLVENPITLGVEDLIHKFKLEERIYRHRCVEAWSMVVPWLGFQMSKLVKYSNPLSSAKYIKFTTFYNPKIASEQKARWYPWPYTEGLTIEEANNELSFLVFGAYGKNLHNQFGAPIRLHLPWKYGFKSIKSIVEIEFTDIRPVSFWENLASNEYGFWANVNPDVDHPRWSQKTERILGGGERKTEIYNGYGPEVSSLYSNFSQLGDKLFR